MSRRVSIGSARQVVYGNDRKQDLGYDVTTMRLAGRATTRGNGTDKIEDYLYYYHENGLISSIYDLLDANYNRGYHYNGRNQLKKMEYRVGYWEYWKHTNYTYDAWGNYTGQYTVVPASDYSALTFNYANIGSSQTPATNRLSSAVSSGWNQSTVQTNFSYDNAGNMTQAGTTTYEWDAANRLQSVNSGALGSYGYDGNGKRVKKTEGGATTYYVYSSMLKAAAMEVAATGVQRAYVMNGGAVVAQLNPNGNFYWLHVDHLGSGRKMTDTAGNVVYRAEFEPYGKLLYEWGSTSNLNTKKFTGYERDASTGLDYAQARMYASEWGRFLSPDPAGMGAVKAHSPQSLNRYRYASNDPVNRVDLTGKFDGWWDLISLWSGGRCHGGAIGPISEGELLYPVYIYWSCDREIEQPELPPPPPEPVQPLQAEFSEQKLMDCINDLFPGVAFTLGHKRDTTFSFTRKGGFLNAIYWNKGIFSDSIDRIRIKVDTQRYTSDQFGAAKGVIAGLTFPGDFRKSNTVYVASDFANDPKVADIFITASSVHEVGNGLSLITGHRPAPKNKDNFARDPNPGAALEECVFGGKVLVDGTLRP